METEPNMGCVATVTTMRPEGSQSTSLHIKCSSVAVDIFSSTSQNSSVLLMEPPASTMALPMGDQWSAATFLFSTV